MTTMELHQFAGIRASNEVILTRTAGIPVKIVAGLVGIAAMLTNIAAISTDIAAMLVGIEAMLPDIAIK